MCRSRTKQRHHADTQTNKRRHQNILAGDIAEKTKRQRERLGQLADQVDRENKRHNAPADHIARLADHVIKIADHSQSRDAGVLRIEKDQNRQ